MIMKRFFYFCILICASLSSCTKDEHNGIGNCPQPDVVGLMHDGGTLSEVNMYCFDAHDPNHPKGYEYLNKVKTLDSYCQMELYVDTKEINKTYESSDMFYIAKEHYLKRTSCMVKDYQLGLMGWPCFYTAYTNGEVSITCDKVLFGKEAGANLSEHFIINSYTSCLPVGIDSPKLLCNYGEKMPILMNEYFAANNTWFTVKYKLYLASDPSEKYDELTFKLSIPLLIEDVHKYVVSKYNGTNEPMKTTERTFEAECKVKFNW